MNTSDPTAADRTLTVRVASPDESFDDVADRLADLNRGEEPEPLYRVTLQDVTDLQRLLSPKTIELLQTIASKSPESSRELAQLVDRDLQQVHDILQELEPRGFVDLEQAGRVKRPTVWFDDIEIEGAIAP